MSIGNSMELGITKAQEALGKAGIVTSGVHSAGDTEADIVVALPSGEERLALEFKSAVFPQSIKAIANQQRLDPSCPHRLLIVARLTQSSFDRCREHGVCVVDLSGNAFIDLPGVYVERYVEQKPPTRTGSSGTAFTAKGSRLVRAFLADVSKTWSQAELVEATGVSAGYVSTRVRMLLAKGYCRKSGDRVSVAEPDQLLDDWAAAYRFDRHSGHQFAISMASYEQGLEKLAAELRRCGVRFAFTGWSGAFLRAPYAISDVLMAYVDRLPDEKNQRIIHPVPKQGNAILLRPHDEGVFQFTQQQGDFVEVVSDAQLFIDLSKMPGRATEQANVLREQRLTFSEPQT